MVDFLFRTFCLGQWPMEYQFLLVSGEGTAACFKVATYKPLLYDSHRAISFAMTYLYLAINLERVFYYNGISIAEGTGFWTPRPTGPSSGVVASILLVSPGLHCPEVCLAEICATCLENFQFILVIHNVKTVINIV